MAKAADKVNKSQVIRDMLKQHRKKTPMQLSDLIKSEHGLEVPPQYISTIKSNLRAKKLGRKILGIQKKSQGTAAKGSDVAGILPAAVQFIKAAGGLDSARAALDQIAEVAKVAR